MCACDWNYVCAHHRGRWPWDPDRALEQSPREIEDERRERDLGRPDFLQPFRDAA